MKIFAVIISVITLVGCTTASECIPPQIDGCEKLPKVEDNRIPKEVLLDEKEVRFLYGQCREKVITYQKAWDICT